MIRIVLGALLLAVTLGPARANTDFCTLDAVRQLHDKEFQRALIAVGLVHSEVGSASEEEVQLAIRQLNGTPAGANNQPLSSESCARLKNLQQEFTSFARLSERSLGNNALHALLPETVMTRGEARLTRVDSRTLWWDADTRDWSFGIDLHRTNRFDRTPLSVLSSNVVYWRNTTYFYNLNTSAETAAEGIGDFTHRIRKPDGTREELVKRYYFHHRVLAFSGHTKGLQLKFSITPPDWFEPPSFLAPAMSTRAITDEIRRKFGTTDDRTTAWLIHAGSLMNLVSSHFAETNARRAVLVPASTQPGDEACELRAHKIEPTRRKLRIVFGTTRALAEEARRKSRQVIDSGSLPLNSQFSADPDADSALHVGCAILSAPRSTGLTQADEGWRGWLPSFMRPKSDEEARLEQIELRELNRLPPVARDEQASIRIVDALAGNPGSTRRPARQRGLLIIHGYNASFSWALEQVAKLTAGFDSFSTPIYVFSWPSDGESFVSWLKYFREADQAEAAQTALQDFISAIFHHGNIRTLDVVAHSMGTLQALRALERISATASREAPFRDRAGLTQDRPQLRLGQIIFASPDIDEAVFSAKIPILATYAERITVYTSSSDCVLYASGLLRGTSRAGYFTRGEQPMRIETRDDARVHVIDTAPESQPWYSVCKDSARGHADHIYDPRVTRDIRAVLSRRTLMDRNDPSQRSGKGPGDTTFCPVKYKNSDGFYWVMRTNDANGRANCPPSE